MFFIMQSPLEIRHLRTLKALCDSGSLSRAAELLCLTQSALSHQIRLLESAYGMPLFERKSMPPRFTAVGSRLLKLAHAVLPLVEEAERDLARLAAGTAGHLRIAVECHTCFDWLIPAMDAFRERWPEVELDIVSGFHADPVALIHQGRADFALTSEIDPKANGIDYLPLFSYEIVAVMANGHPLAAARWLEAADFANETLITYPVPDEMLDIVRQVLAPAGIRPKRRTTELTIVLLQLVASGRGIAALPLWAVQSYLERGYVQSRRIGREGLSARLYGACLATLSRTPYLTDFIALVREKCFLALPGITLL
ncbi:MAG: LysR family transcriptional regulator [Thiobacillaceae bacterium]